MRKAAPPVLVWILCLCWSVRVDAQEPKPIIEIEFGAGLLDPVADVPCCVDAQINLWLHRGWGIGVGVVNSIGTDDYEPPRISAAEPGRLVLGAKNFQYFRITGLYRSAFSDLDIELGLGTYFRASSQAIFRETDGRTVTETTIRYPSGVAVHALLGTTLKGPFGLKGGVRFDVNDDGYFIQPVGFATVNF